MKLLFLAGLAFCSVAFGAPLKEFTPGEIWPDDHGMHINAHGGGILLYKGTYYWFGEHKIAGTAGNRAHVGVRVYSSKDLYNWKDEGIALAVSTNLKSDITEGCIIERPKVIYNAATRKFVMWFHLEYKSTGPEAVRYRTARSGVAVADKPEGPYTYLYSLRPNAGQWPLIVPSDGGLPQEAKPADFSDSKEPDRFFLHDVKGGQMARDMTLFVDDDGRAYQIYASEENQTLQISLLTPDYLKPAGRFFRVLPGAYNEAPTIFKRNGKYYLISSGCSGWIPNAARLAVADSIGGPWTALSNPVRGTKEQADRTFDSQSTYVLPAPGHPGEFIFMADSWRPKNAIDGRYVWLPIQWEDGKPVLKWLEHWDLSFFD
jgi:beta-xylosidase